MSGERLRAAVAASSLAGAGAHDDLLRSIVETARAIFRARASSITLYDEEADQLEFRAVAGEGSDRLVGRRFPASEGVAGWVVRSGEAMVIDDVGADPRFSREVAESTGYVPRGLMAVPLVREERVLGVLSVLDRPADERFTAAEMQLLGRFASQAAIALDIVESARGARALLEADADAALVARVAVALDTLQGERREAGRRLLAALEDVLGDPSPSSRGHPARHPVRVGSK